MAFSLWNIDGTKCVDHYVCKVQIIIENQWKQRLKRAAYAQLSKQVQNDLTSTQELLLKQQLPL